MPVTYWMRLLLRKNLAANLNTLAALPGAKEGVKLRFLPEKGLFEHANNSVKRTLENLFSKSEQSATNKAMFHDPILVTLYECKKLCLKPIDRLLLATEHLGDPPAVAFKNALAGLRHLKDSYTFNTAGIPLNSATAELQRHAAKAQEALRKVIEKAQKLWNAPDRDSLDRLMTDYFGGFDIPLDRLPNDLPLTVVRAATDDEIKGVIDKFLAQHKQGGIQFKAFKQAQSAVETIPSPDPTKLLHDYIKDLIYDKFYSTGGHVLAVPPHLDNERYEAALNALAARYSVKAEKKKDGYFHLCDFRSNAACTARVYIHLKADPDGKEALGALKVLCDYVTKRGKVEEALRKDVNFFKICTKLSTLYERLDSAVVYMGTMAGAKALAMALSRDLEQYTADGLPAWVRTMRRGIGVATEPEVQLSKNNPKDLKKFSYGSHRSEIIARGLIAAAMKYDNCLPKNPAEYMPFVEWMFENYEIDISKPYKRGRRDEADVLVGW
jgi:hypothetical protein